MSFGESLMFQRNISPPSSGLKIKSSRKSALKMEVIYFSETLCLLQTAWLSNV
jgi:hypothetical protein